LAEHPRHSVFHADGGLAVLVGYEPASCATATVANKKNRLEAGSFTSSQWDPQEEKWHLPPRYPRSTSAFFALTLS